MFYKIGKDIFHFLIDFLHFIQVTLVFLAFFTTLYWLLQIAGVGWTAAFSPFFEPIKDLVHLFYTRKVTTDGTSVDFAFLIGSFAMLFVSWGLKFIVDFIKTVEEKYDLIHRELKDKAEKNFNKDLERNYIGIEHKNKKILILMSFSAKNLAKDVFYNRDVEVGADEKQKIALNDFCNNLAQTVTFQKRMLEEKVLLYFDKFDDIDKILDAINTNLDSIRTQLKSEKWQLNYCLAIDTYSGEKELSDKFNTLKLLLKLNLQNEIISLATFKQRYSLVKKAKYFIESKGVYKIHNEEDVFCLKNKEKDIKHL